MSDFSATGDMQERFKGVFSTSKAAYIGTGDTKRKVMQQVYFYVEEQADGTLMRQPLNPNYVPSGEVQEVDREELMDKFSPEPEILTQKMIPAMKALTKTLAKAERLRNQGQPFTAEHEFQNALKMDDRNARANFGLGLTLLDQGEVERADEVFQHLVTLDETFKPENKHLFNEFGIQMRKNGMYAQALKYYDRAYVLSHDDENLLYNMARTHYEKGEFEPGLKIVEKALGLRKDFPEAEQLRKVLEKELKG